MFKQVSVLIGADDELHDGHQCSLLAAKAENDVSHLGEQLLAFNASVDPELRTCRKKPQLPESAC